MRLAPDNEPKYLRPILRWGFLPLSLLAFLYGIWLGPVPGIPWVLPFFVIGLILTLVAIVIEAFFMK
jgi:hypothetical protein